MSDRSFRWKWWCLAGLVVALAGPGAAPAQVQRLDRAVARVHTEAHDKVSEVTLPYHWDRHNPDQPGTASFDIVFSLAQVPATHMAFSIPQIGSAYEIWLNGAIVQRRGDLQTPDSDDFSKTPQYVDIPGKLLRQDNLLRVNIRADSGRRAGLAAITFGPDPLVTGLHDTFYDTKVVGSLAVVTFSLMLGVGAFALWITQVQSGAQGAKRDGLYLAACIAEFSWAFRVADVMVEHPPLAWPQWSVVMTFASACWVGGMVVFCCYVAGWQRHWLLAPLARSASVFGAITAVCATLAGAFHWSAPLSIWFGAVIILYCLFTICFCWAATRPGASRMHQAAAIAAAFNAAAGLRDMIVFRLSDVYGDQVWLRFSSVAFGVTLAYIVIHRFRSAGSQLRELSGRLAAQVALKEAELARTYEQLAQTTGWQARMAERTRVLRDMHDGVGAHLSSAIRQLQSGRANNEQLLQTLRDSLDQLRFSTDAINVPAGDLGSLLAGLRRRLEPRFAASDVELQWRMDPMPALRGYDPAAMRHLQFMVFEALSNVLQHAQARVLTIEATRDGAGARLRIMDDGRGFDTGRPWRRGLLSMRDRAAAIGVRLSLESRPGRTVVEIALPEKTG